MDRDRARQLLRHERERIERALARQTDPPDDELTTRDQHLGDQATELYDDELTAGLRGQLTGELAAVKRRVAASRPGSPCSG